LTLVATLVFDSAPLCCFGRAKQLELLERLTAGAERVTTQAVLDEIRDGVSEYPELQEVLELRWLRVERLETLEHLRLFALYARRLGADQHNVGEASVLAWAEAHGALAFTDDQAAVTIARERSVKVQRTLALVARGVRRGLLTEAQGDALADELLRAGGRFPFAPGEFIAWARRENLLLPSR
jgi:predicted nucleic acid-binding protein